MKIVVVYLGQASMVNFDHSVQTGVWGFTNNAKPDQPFYKGDILFFASGYAGNIRLPEDEWLTHSINLVATAAIESPLAPEKPLHWPDELTQNKLLYPNRFQFSNLQKKNGPFALGDVNLFPRDLILSLRRAAIGNKAQVVEIPALPPWLTSGADSPPTPQPAPPVPPPAPLPPPPPRSIPDTLLEISNYIASRGFIFSSRVLRSFYASLRSKPFAILAGNSGTGKSKLVRLFAEASGATVDNGRFTMIPVRPDWNDSSELLGYVDLNGAFIPGKLIPALLMAHQESTKPFFVCLDEMNLARVEHYFSDFLSIIESRRRNGGPIVTDPILSMAQLKAMKPEGLRSEAQAALKHLVATGRPLILPENLFITGTVNMDETTQPFSRKVLDRAHTLEFNDIDLLEGLDEAVSAAEVPALNLDQPFFKPEFTSLNDLLAAHRDKAKVIAGFVDGLNEDLSIGGFSVGYRVRDEAISFAVYAEQAGINLEEVKESIVLQKILPRIQGSSPRVEKVLVALMRKLKGDAVVPEFEDPNYAEGLAELHVDAEAPAVLRKIAGMLRLYGDENFTSFWLV